MIFETSLLTLCANGLDRSISTAILPLSAAVETSS